MKSKLVKFCKSPKNCFVEIGYRERTGIDGPGSRKLTKELLKIFAITELAMLNSSKEVVNVTIDDFN